MILACGHSARIAVPMPDARAAAADRNQHGRDVGQIVRDLQADGALPRDDVRVVEWRDQHASGQRHHLVGDLLPLARAAQHHLGAVAAGRRHLHARSFLGHHDVSRDAEHRGRVRDGLGVVAARIGDHSPCPGDLVEPPDRVERATDLESADGLQVLGFDPQWSVRIAPGGGKQRSAEDVTPDAIRGGADVVDRDQLHGSSLSAAVNGDAR